MPAPKDPIKAAEWKEKIGTANSRPSKLKGRKLSPETRLKLSLSHKGQISPNKGKKASLETREKQRLSHLGYVIPIETRIKMSLAQKGKPKSKEHIQKVILALTGIKRTPEQCKVLSERMKGVYSGDLNPSKKPEVREKISQAKRGKCIGPAASNWQGGISFEPHCPKFTKEFKERVREYFGYCCVECGKTQEENKRKLPVHHVNFDKQTCCNSTIPLFVPLCTSCHMKTNFNREFWQYWFTELINRRYGGKCYSPKTNN